MNIAEEIMRAENPNGLIGVDEDGATVMIEDVGDPDGRLYRMEYRSAADGSQAVAYCRHNPWGGFNGGEPYETSHVDANGFICVGPDHSGHAIAGSPYDLTFVIRRARFWCAAFSVLKETGEFPQ